MLLNLTILPGDGIGPEVTEQAVLVLQAIADGFGHQLQLQYKPIGGAALTIANDPLPADTLQACLASSAALLAKYFPNSKSIIFPGIGHLPYEECPDEFNRALIEFLTREKPPA